MLWNEAIEHPPSSIIFLALYQAMRRGEVELTQLVEQVASWPEDVERQLPKEDTELLFKDEPCEALQACNALLIADYKFNNGDMKRLVEQPHIGKIRTLRMHNCTLKSTHVSVFRLAASLAKITTLELHDIKSSKVSLTEFNWTGNLQHISIVGCAKISAGYFLNSFRAAKLKTFTYQNNDSSDYKYIESLDVTVNLRHLEELNVSPSLYKLTDDFYRIFQNEALDSLHTLRFSHTAKLPHSALFNNKIKNLESLSPLHFLDDGFWNSLLNDPVDTLNTFDLETLKESPVLVLSEEREQAIRQKFKDDPYKSWSDEELDHILRERPFEDLTGPSILSQLKRVHFTGYSDIHQEVLLLLMSSGTLDHMQELCMYTPVILDKNLSDPLSKALSERPFKNLETLNVSVKIKDAKAAENFAQSACMSSLRTLSLNVDVPKKSKSSLVAPLFQAENLAHIEHLSLDSYHYTFDGESLQGLIESKGLNTLQTLDIKCTDEAFEALLAASKLPNLRDLDLSGSKIKSIKTLINHPALSTLERLNLSGLKIPTEDMDALLKSPHFRGLELLDIRKTKLDNDYLIELRDNPPLVLELLTDKIKKSTKKATPPVKAKPAAIAQSKTQPLSSVLEALLKESPSTHTFTLLIRALNKEEHPEQHLDALLNHVASWPEDVERRTPTSWIERTLSGEEVVLLQACNTLDIRGQKLNKNKFNTILKCTHLKGIHTLRANGCKFAKKTAQLLAEHPWKDTLKNIYLRNISWTDDEIEALGKTGFFAQANTLDVINSINSEKQMHLALAHFTETRWQTLYVNNGGAHVDVNEETALVRVCHEDMSHPHLEDLAVHINPSRTEHKAYMALIQSKGFPKLNRLRWVASSLWSKMTTTQALLPKAYQSPVITKLETLPPVRVEAVKLQDKYSYTPNNVFVNFTEEQRTQAIEFLKQQQQTHAPDQTFEAHHRLSEEDIFHNFSVSDWVSTPAMQNRKELTLSGLNSWSEDMFDTFFTSESITSSLEALHLDAYSIHPKLLAFNEKLTQLKHLTMNDREHYNTEPYKGGSPVFQQLESLTLTSIDSSYKSLTNLVACPDFTQLKSLSILKGPLSKKGVELLTEAAFLSQLHTLNLPENKLGDTGLMLLLMGDHFDDKNLHTLDLSNNNISAEGAKLLANQPSMENLRTLNLSNNKIKDEGLEAILNSPHMKNLRTLIVTKNGLSKATQNLLSTSVTTVYQIVH